METQNNSDAYLLQAYADLKQKHSDLETLCKHLQYRLNRATDSNFKLEERLTVVENNLKEKQEEVNKLKELRRADGLEIEHHRLTAENLLREVTHLNELRRTSNAELNLKEQEALAYKTWYEAEVDKPDNDSWKRKYDTLVSATDFCVDLIKSALKGKVYKQLTVNWEDESAKPDSEQCSTTDSLSC